MTIRPQLFAALAAPLALAACFGGSNVPDALLTLTPAERRQPAAPRTAEQGRVITVTVPSVPQALRARRVPVYVSDTSIQYLQEATWVEGPNELFRSLLSETIAARTGLTIVDPATYSQVQGMTLGGQLLRFGLDPSANEVVMIFEASLARPGQAVSTNRFEARVPVADQTAPSVAPALNQAANQVAQQVADWIGR